MTLNVHTNIFQYNEESFSFTVGQIFYSTKWIVWSDETWRLKCVKLYLQFARILVSIQREVSLTNGTLFFIWGNANTFHDKFRMQKKMARIRRTTFGLGAFVSCNYLPYFGKSKVIYDLGKVIQLKYFISTAANKCYQCVFGWNESWRHSVLRNLRHWTHWMRS